MVAIHAARAAVLAGGNEEHLLNCQVGEIFQIFKLRSETVKPKVRNLITRRMGLKEIA